MITWIQTVLQKHHKFVFGILLVAIIIAFVFTIGSVPFFGDVPSYGGAREKREFCGYDLKDEGTLAHFQNLAVYEIILDGQMLQSQQQVEMFMLRQMYLTALARELGLRQVTEQELSDYLHSRPLFRNPDGSFNASAWEKFKSERLASGRMTDAQLTSIIANNAMVDKVSKILGGPGYVVPGQIERQFKLLNAKWDLALASLAFDGFNPEIKPDEAALKKFFDANAQSYKAGEGASVEAIFMPLKDFAALVPAPKDSDLQVFYGANMKRYSEDKDGRIVTPEFSKIKSKVLADYLTDAAQTKAKQAGEDVAMKIYESGAKMGSAELKKLLADMKIEPKKIGDIRMTDEALPKDFPAQVAAAAMRLTTDQFYSDPILTDDGIWIVLISKRLDSYLPTFEQVKQKVEKDFIASEKRRLFNEKAASLSESLRKAAAEGKDFAAAAKSGGAAVSELNGFSLSKPDVSDYQTLSLLRDQLPRMKAGSVSEPQTVGGKAYIVFAKKVEQPAVAENSKEFAEISKSARESMGTLGASSVVGSKISEVMREEPEE
ncbi:MAG: hypothetical protein DBX55_07170 [Verrucomicrobia bacterium]|nr:MAG: hypothetical protein DBX55_07170 [Verrucomicrobiota bacterium]